MKILQILAHPDYDNKNRISNLLAELGEEELRKKYNNITTLNLYDPKCYIPVMDKNMLSYGDKKGKKNYLIFGKILIMYLFICRYIILMLFQSLKIL